MKHDEAVYIWFKQKRMEGTPISGPILCEKAVQLYKKMHGEESVFSASTGWQWRFCKRHGIRNLSLQGEKLSANLEVGKDFVTYFSEFIETSHLSMDQIFNCDETGLNFRLLPDKTLAASFETSADGRKKSKERVTINACSNASGTIKLPLQVIGKANRPRCFKSVRMDLLPVEYCGQRNAWMSRDIFHKWFHDSFIPIVRKELESLGHEKKAVLVLDNCPAHPNVEDLISSDGKITAIYLPPNVTSLIQPMDQGVLVALKRRYKKKLLRKLLIEDDVGTSIIDFFKSIDMKVVVHMIAESWDEIEASTLRKSWRKIIPIQSQETGEVEVEEVAFDLEDDAEFMRGFGEIGCELNPEDLHAWLNSDCHDPGFPILTDDEICEQVSSEPHVEAEEDEPEEQQHHCPVMNSEAAHMFDKCLTWLENQAEANLYNLCTLKELRNLAIHRRTQSLKQMTLTDMLPKTQ